MLLALECSSRLDVPLSPLCYEPKPSEDPLCGPVGSPCSTLLCVLQDKARQSGKPVDPEPLVESLAESRARIAQWFPGEPYLSKHPCCCERMLRRALVRNWLFASVCCEASGAACASSQTRVLPLSFVWLVHS